MGLQDFNGMALRLVGKGLKYGENFRILLAPSPRSGRGQSEPKHEGMLK